MLRELCEQRADLPVSNVKFPRAAAIVRDERFILSVRFGTRRIDCLRAVSTVVKQEGRRLDIGRVNGLAGLFTIR